MGRMKTFLKKIFFVILVSSLLIANSAPLSAAKNLARSNYTKIDFVSGADSSLALLVSDQDLSFDLATDIPNVRLKIDSSQLYDSSGRFNNIKVVAY